jgi:hypothetical protein
VPNIAHNTLIFRNGWKQLMQFSGNF